MTSFRGYHSEWNLGSPGGWDYQRITQEIAQVVWQRLNRLSPTGVELDFDHPMLYPVVGFTEMLLDVFRQREGNNQGLIAVVAEEETLTEVTENINLAKRLDRVDGVTGILAAPHEFERSNGRVCHRGRPVSLVFMDFNNDVFLKLHRQHDLSPLMQAIGENRVLNPRGTEPINVKSMFEVFTGPLAARFEPETVQRTPWTRRFFERATDGPRGETIRDLVAWTRSNWPDLVLKPERGYSGIGVMVGRSGSDADAAIAKALEKGHYIVQQKVPLNLWAEAMPEVDPAGEAVRLATRQTDFRCLIGPHKTFGFLCRYGDVPTNVGSGGGVQPLTVLKSKQTVGQAVEQINRTIANLHYSDLKAVEDEQNALALEAEFTYLLGPIKIALRPRIITAGQLNALDAYGRAMWNDSLKLEKMWQAGELDEYVDIEEEELEIARLQPWQGGPAIFAADGLFGFGAEPEVS
ncbi:MAG: hypothetical protein QNI89_01280 [Desulfobacterales bacterium]|nr:hypothetical protein [Desulfobacterales bacterium]